MMDKIKSFLRYGREYIPKKYRLIVFLIITSIIGVLLIIFAVYNTSEDLEIVHEVDNLHRLANSSLSHHNHPEKFAQALAALSADEYNVLIFENGHRVSLVHDNFSLSYPENISELEQSRINSHGGFLENNGEIYTWAMLFVNSAKQHMVLIHKFASIPLSSLINIYLKRLLVPGIFYIWLMVWVALILRFLTDKLISQNEELEHMALHDSLTGLPNRILLNDRIEKLIQDCRRSQGTFALAVIDLNKFKVVNDTLGHEQGDELLRLVAHRINGILRGSDTFARIGGDEFVLLLNGVNTESCLGMCERIKSSLLKPYSLKDDVVTIGLSIGIAMFPEHGNESITLMRNADIAMYIGKAKGEGIQVYTVKEERQNNANSLFAARS